MIDIYHSRRGHYRRCKYFVRDERVTDISLYVHNALPTGIFYATEINPLQNSKENINSAIQYDKDSITLYTDDETDGLETGCIVVYRYSPWIVDGVQRKFHIKETEFSQKEHCTTIITLRK